MNMSLADYTTGRVLSWTIQCLCIAQMVSVVYLTNQQERMMHTLSRATIQEPSDPQLNCAGIQ